MPLSEEELRELRQQAAAKPRVEFLRLKAETVAAARDNSGNQAQTESDAGTQQPQTNGMDATGVPANEASHSQDVVETPEKQSVEALWKTAMEDFEKLTDRPLGFTTKSQGEIEKQLELIVSEEDKDDGVNHMKEMGMNLLAFIKLVAGVAAKGVSIIFGPADVCFNAISILLDIPRKVHELHEAVRDLIREVSVLFSHFRIYSRIEEYSHIDHDLYKTVEQLLLSFVDIVALCVNIGKDANWQKRVKLAGKKIFFNNDSKIREKLDNFKSLIERQNSIEGLVTLENVLRTRSDISQLLNSASETEGRLLVIGDGIVDLQAGAEVIGTGVVNLEIGVTNLKSDTAGIMAGVEVLTKEAANRGLDTTTKEQIKTIREKLSIKQETTQGSEKLCRQLFEESVQSTGSWLRGSLGSPGILDYKNWLDLDSTASPLLLITGDAHTGKSHLVAAIIRELESVHGISKAHSSEQEPLVAYHFFPPNTEKNTHGQRPVETALKCLAVQIAEKDKSYAKITAAYCDGTNEQNLRDSGCKDLWEALKFGVSKNRAYILLLDGIDQLPEYSGKDQLLQILESLQQPRTTSDKLPIRLLVSGLTNENAGTFDKTTLSLAPRIEIAEHNSQEISFFIDQELQRRDLLLGNEAETLRWRNTIKSMLPLKAKGNFFKVQTAIEKINEVVTSDREGAISELNSILQEAGQERDKIAQNELSVLSDALSVREIEELNELLVWAVFGIVYLKVKELKAALYLAFKTSSIQPLEKKLSGKYSKVFTISASGYVMAKEDIEKIVKTPFSTRKPDDAPKISATITITKVGGETVHNFLWDLTRKAIDKFEFDNSAAMIKTKGTIEVNEFDSHHKLAKQCFSILNSDANELTEALGYYSLCYLPTHLMELRRPDMIKNMTPMEKSAIGKSVFDLLADGNVLKTHWKTPQDDGLFFEEFGWFEFGDEASLGPFWDWLTDDDAIKYLGKKDREWLLKLKSESCFKQRQNLLEPLTLMVADQWLRHREWDAFPAFKWVHNFLELGNKKVSDDVPMSTSNDNQAADDKGTQNESDSDDTSESEADSDSDSDSDIDTEDISVAADWVMNALKEDKLDSLWHERLGQTYMMANCTELAIIEFKKSTALVQTSWQCFQSLAEAYEQRPEDYSEGTEKTSNLVLATTEMEKSLEILKGIESPTADVKSSIIHNLSCLAGWREQLSQPEVAIKCYEEIFAVDPGNAAAQVDIIKVLLSMKDEDRTRKMLEKMSNEKANDLDLSQLAAILRLLAHEDDSDAIFNSIFLATHKTSFFGTLLQHLNSAIDFAELEKRTYDRALLLLYKGIAIYHYDQRDERTPDIALTLWEEVASLNSTEGRWWNVNKTTFRLISSYHFLKARIASDPTIHIKKMEENSSRRFGTGYTDSYARSYLGAYYALTGQPAKAKEVLMADMKTGLALLSDEDDWNDYQGYRQLSETLMHSGDDLHALSAWSLLGPTDGFDAPSQDQTLHEVTVASDTVTSDGPDLSIKDQREDIPAEDPDLANQTATNIEIIQPPSTPQPSAPTVSPTPPRRSGNLGNSCDGACGTVWPYADDFYCCKICSDVQLCPNCLPKLQAGTLRTFVCHPKHEWLHVPKWHDEDFPETRLGKVKVGGMLVDGGRVGGEAVSVEEWLNIVRDGWGIPRFVREKKEVVEDVEPVGEVAVGGGTD